MRNALIAKHTLLFSPGLHIEDDKIIVIEEMKPYFAKLDLNNCPDTARYLSVIKETG